MTTKKKRKLGTLAVIAATGAILTGCGPPGEKQARQGEQLVEAGEFAAAIAPLKEAADILGAAPGPAQSKVWNLLGLAYHGARQLDGASEAYGRALKLDRNNVAADYNLGCLRLEQGNLQGAIDYLTTFVALRPHDVSGYLQLGEAQYHQALERAGVQHNVLMEDARHNFEMAERWGKTAQAPNALGVIEMQRRFPTADSIKTAAGDFQRALERDPRFAPALLNLAIVQQQYLNQSRQALENYRKCLESDPAIPHAREIEKTVHRMDVQLRITITPEQGGTPAATPARNAVPPTNPPTNPPPARAKPVGAQPPPAPVLAVASAPAPEKPAAALPAPAPPPTPPPKSPDVSAASAPPAAPAAVSSAPPSPPVKTSNITTDLPAVAVAPPPPAPARKTLVEKIDPQRWFSGGPASASAPAGETAPEEPPLAPKGSRYKYPLPVTLIPGDRGQALRWTEEGAKARQEVGLDEALRYYKEAVRADPTCYDAELALGLAAVDKRDYDKAMEAFIRALQVRGDSAGARYAFAWTLQKRGYYQDAAAELEKLLAAHPEEVRGHLLLGKLYAERLNEPKQARQHYAKALELDPQNAQAEAIRAWIGANR